MQMIVRKKLLWATVASLISAPALALDGNAADIQPILDMSLEQLMNVEVTTASKYAQKSSEAPSAVTVLTADDIRTFGYRTLTDALHSIRGLHINQDRNYDYLGQAGVLRPNDYNARVLVMVNGRRINDDVYDQASLGQDFILDMELVDRIEYISGPGSSIYGANAFLGVVNVITKKGKDFNGGEVASEVGTFDTRKHRITYGKKLENGADVMLSAARFRSDGDERLYFPEFDDPATNNGVAEHMDKEIARRFFAMVSYNGLTFTTAYVNRDKRVPTASYGAIFNDRQYNSNDSAGFAELKYETALSDKTLLEARAFYQGYRFNAVQPYDDGFGNRVVYDETGEGRWWGGEAKLVTTAFENHKIVAGVEYQYDQMQKFKIFDRDPSFLYLRANGGGSRIGLFAQDDIRLTNNLILSAGIRGDWHHLLNHDAQWNPRLGLIWNPQQSTTLKLLYGSAFRAPNYYERAYDLPAFGLTANPDNKEERIKTYQGIVEWQGKDGLKLTGMLYYNDLDNIMEPDEVTGKSENAGKFRTVGYEFEALKRWTDGRMLKVSYSHTNLKDERRDSWATASPKNTFKLHYGTPVFGNRATLGFESIYVDERKTVQGNTASDYNLANVNLSFRKILPGLDATFGVYNAFNAHPQMVGGNGSTDLVQDVIKMNGRNVRFKLEYQF